MCTRFYVIVDLPFSGVNAQGWGKCPRVGSCGKSVSIVFELLCIFGSVWYKHYKVFITNLHSMEVHRHSRSSQACNAEGPMVLAQATRVALVTCLMVGWVYVCYPYWVVST